MGAYNRRTAKTRAVARQASRKAWAPKIRRPAPKPRRGK